MDQIQYIGETLWPAHVGKFLLVIGFLASGLSAISYCYATNRREKMESSSWMNLGRLSFSVHGISIIGLMGLIFYIMINQMYEYQYVQAHVSDDLPMRYIFSAFWEGQEGSFLLWLFWHIVLGLFIISRKGKFEAPVIALLSLTQLIITSMLLGVYIDLGNTEFKIGSSPILLLRDVMDVPIFANADYVSLIKGQGLNPLLQNYWNTIHPPVVFLGFASTTIPFCYAIAGLWTKEYENWLKPGLYWALFSGFALGSGILMGAAWAYEALTFGGYWAWDPVENMSLVPWLILIAGIHTHLVAKATGHSIRSTAIFYVLSFVLILYSTFLTRSGVLGDTSAHAFTEMGLEWQLVGLIFTFLLIGTYTIIKHWKKIPSPQKEESMTSREFWMFIGSLVLFFSGLLIASSTSLPVYNKIVSYFNPDYVGKVINDPIDHYNQYQLWIAIFMAVLSGSAILLRYRGVNWAKKKAKFFQIAGGALIISIFLDLIFAQWINVQAWQYHLLSITAFFIILTNLYYLISVSSMNMKSSGSVMSHIGFGIMILGIMASGLSKNYITSNPFAQKGLLDDELIEKNLILVKDQPMFSKNYWMTYESDTLMDKIRKFTIDFRKVDDQNQTIEQFKLYPNAQLSNDFSKVAAFNPSTKRYLHKDIFTHIGSLPRPQMDVELAKEMEDTIKYTRYDLPVGGFIDSSDYSIKIVELRSGLAKMDSSQAMAEPTLFADLEIVNKSKDTTYLVSPSLALNGLLVYSVFEELPPLNMRVKINESFFDEYFTQDNLLNYKDYVFKQGETKEINNYKVTLVDFEREVSHPNYDAKEGDIAIEANIRFEHLNDPSLNFEAKPIYIIRDNRPFSIKSYNYASGIHSRLKNINPTEETFTLAFAWDDREFNTIPLEVSTNVPRSDIIVLQAIEFPGINMVWLGTILMMIGLLFSMIVRLRQKKNVQSA